MGLRLPGLLYGWQQHTRQNGHSAKSKACAQLPGRHAEIFKIALHGQPCNTESRAKDRSKRQTDREQQHGLPQAQAQYHTLGRADHAQSDKALLTAA